MAKAEEGAKAAWYTVMEGGAEAIATEHRGGDSFGLHFAIWYQ